MKCTVISVLCFIGCSVFFGSSYAGVAQGLKHFTAGVFQTFRMLFGSTFVLIFLIVRILMYPQFKKLFFSISKDIYVVLMLMIGGLINLGIPHCLTAIAQDHILSSMVQIMQPIAPLSGAILSHFVLSDEKFTMIKFISLVLALVGVALSAVPSFLHVEGGSKTTDLVVGYILTLFAMIGFGTAPVFFKKLVPGIDPIISVIYQLFASVIFELLFALIKDGPRAIKHQVKEAEPFMWFWPTLIGVLVSGVTPILNIKLLNDVGAFGANLIPCGQMVIGVIVGVSILKEWSSYKGWEIGISVVGFLLLIVSIIVSLFTKDSEQGEEEEEEGEEKEIPEL